MLKISVVGLGYIGLPTSALLAKAGHCVKGVDVNPSVITSINAGQSHFQEKGLDDLVKEQVLSGNLSASTNLETSDAFLIIVPTPFNEDDKTADMSYVQSASRSIAAVLKAGDLVVLESTSALGATEKDVKAVVETERPDLVDNVHYAFCPERAIPGNTLHELENNDRVVGGLDDASTVKAVSLYQSFCKGEVLKTTANVAEMVKLSENAFRDVNIAYANELSIVCQKLGIDVWDVIKLANHHPRVNILQPGPGVGGHCIAVDPWFIVAAAGGDAPLMTAARHVNDGKPHWVLQQVEDAIVQTGKQKPVVGLLGLAFKPNVDDMRTSPALKVAELIQNNVNAEVIACEPYVEEVKNITLVNQEELLKRSDVVVMLTDHDDFKGITLADLKDKKIVDTRGAIR